jgi:hypothetical protein
MVDAEPPRYSLMVNGLDNAFPREFGCSCERCRRPERAANTSMSLLSTSVDGDMTHFHALIDCGQGTSDSLAANPLLRGERARLARYRQHHETDDRHTACDCSAAAHRPAHACDSARRRRQRGCAGRIAR